MPLLAKGAYGTGVPYARTVRCGDQRVRMCVSLHAPIDAPGMLVWGADDDTPPGFRDDVRVYLTVTVVC